MIIKTTVVENPIILSVVIFLGLNVRQRIGVYSVTLTLTYHQIMCNKTMTDISADAGSFDIENAMLIH